MTSRSELATIEDLEKMLEVMEAASVAMTRSDARMTSLEQAVTKLGELLMKSVDSQKEHCEFLQDVIKEVTKMAEVHKADMESVRTNLKNAAANFDNVGESFNNVKRDIEQIQQRLKIVTN